MVKLSDYHPQTKKINHLVGDRHLKLDLVLTQDGKANLEQQKRANDRKRAFRTEWLSVGFFIGAMNASAGYYSIVSGSDVLLGGQLNVCALKWRMFKWTILELGAGSGVGSGGHLFYFGSAVAYPIYFGRRGQHQISVDLGLGAESLESGFSFAMSPGATYSYHTNGLMFYGLSTKFVLPIGSYPNGYPFQAILSFLVGFQSR